MNAVAAAKSVERNPAAGQADVGRRSLTETDLSKVATRTRTPSPPSPDAAYVDSRRSDDLTGRGDDHVDEAVRPAGAVGSGESETLPMSAPIENDEAILRSPHSR